jgi:hypothetical protein
MAASISTICDPGSYRLNDAIEHARHCAQTSPRFEVDLAKFLQAQCIANRVHLPTIFRGLEVLGEILDEGRLITLLRPFLKSSDSQIVSKCVLVVGRHSHSAAWLKGVMGETDDRIRANLIESLWKRQDVEVVGVLQTAVNDRNHRVAANAVYGLYLAESELYTEALEKLISNRNPAFRRSAVWVIGQGGTSEAAKMKPLIRDSDEGVRRAAFHALVSMRNCVPEKKVLVGDRAEAKEKSKEEIKELVPEHVSGAAGTAGPLTC